MDPFAELPDELIIIQALGLPISSIINLCRVDRRFNALICDNELFWHQRFVKETGFEPRSYVGSWRRLYEEYLNIRRVIGTIHQFRTTAPAGFVVPVLFDNELVDFFAQANLGPLIEGRFITRTSIVGDMMNDPDVNSLRPINQPLNTALFFSQPFIFGERNPLYGVISPSTLTALFALHAHYAGMDNPNKPTRLSASPEMRRFLPTIMERARGFNPEDFPYAHFQNLISAGRSRFLSDENLTLEVTRVYRPFFPGTEVITTQMILEYQNDIVQLARTYKNGQRRNALYRPQ